MAQDVILEGEQPMQAILEQIAEIEAENAALDSSANKGCFMSIVGVLATICLASLGPATFHELRAAFAGVDAHRHTLSFHSLEEFRHLAAAAGFVAVDVQQHTEIAHYADFPSLLRAVKAIGANQLGAGRRGGLLSRNAFQHAERAAEALRTVDGLPLTYDVITLYARK